MAQELTHPTIEATIVGRRLSSAQTRSRHKIHEERNTRRYWMARLERCEERNLIAPVIDQALHQASGFQVFSHVPQRLRRQPAAFKRPPMQHVAAAARKMAADFDLL